MFSSVTVLTCVVSIAAPAPARSKDEWIGSIVCTKSSSPETYQRAENGEFSLVRVRIRYIDMRVVDEKGDHVALQHDETVFWVKKADALRPKDAVLYFTQQLDRNPQDQRAIAARCWANMAIRDYDRALRDADEAVRLSPDSTAWKNNRGEVFVKRKEYEKAIAEFTDLLRQDSEYYFALLNRGEAYLRMKRFKDAISDTEAAMKNEKNVPVLYVNLARAYSIAPDDKLRDGKKALQLIKVAEEKLKAKDGYYFDTRAAVHAELGEFDKAVEFQQRALDDPEYLKDESETAVRKRLTLYRQKKPFRDE